MDRRAGFFLLAAAACMSLYVLTPANLHYVPVSLTVWYAVLALLSFLDHHSRTHS